MRIQCPHCFTIREKRYRDRRINSFGRFYRKSDGQWLTRFWCKPCKKSFSTATTHPCVFQKKRHKNETIRKLISGGMSQREIARTLNLNRKTVVRKFLFLAQKEEEKFRAYNRSQPLAMEVEFDDLETFEHTKLKPLSVTLMVEYKTRRILDFEVSQMPAKGHLAKKAIKKYGYRKDRRSHGRKKLFERARSLIQPNTLLRSDSNPHYGPDVRRYFPNASYETVLGGRGAVTGQGELKKLKWDPIFSLNHTCAMMRANINRLFRKTWCTTKKRGRLRAHLMIYAASHNQRLSTA